MQPGDLCHHGTNALPLYRVIWIHDGKAWLRDVNNGADSVVSLDRCRACGDGDVEQDLDARAKPAPLTWPDGTPRP